MSADHIKNLQIRSWFEQESATTGYTPGMSFADYKKSIGVNASLLKNPYPLKMLRSLNGVEKLTDSQAEAFAFGECVHKATLEPDLFEKGGWQNWFAFSPTAGLVTKAACSMREANPGITLVTQEILDNARRSRDAIYRHHRARQLLEKADTELSGHAWDAEHEVWRKIRVDVRGGIGADYLADIKTTRSVDSMSELTKEVKNRGYDVQGKWYRDTDKIISGIERPRFIFIWVTKTDPFIARVTELDQDHMVDSGRVYLDKLGMFLNAAATDDWEAFENEDIQVHPFTKRVA